MNNSNLYEAPGSILKLQPREKLRRHGIQGLTDRELIQLILGSGIKGLPVDALAQKCLQIIDRFNLDMQLDKLLNIPGIGMAKASLLIAALELSRRFIAPKRGLILKASDALPYFHHYHDRNQEHFLAMSLNGGQEVTHVRLITTGLINRTLIHPRELFAEALKDRAVGIIMAHNHPSGRLEPSREDRELTTRMNEAGHILGIHLLDHIIFSENGYYSFQEHGHLRPPASTILNKN